MVLSPPREMLNGITKEYPITVESTDRSRLAGLDLTKIAFGTVISDHVFVVDYHNGEWQHGHITSYGAMQVSPAISGLHYGQSIFEGMKAFRDQTGKVQLFRAHDHWLRINNSAHRLCMPAIPEALFMNALLELLRVDQAWVPPVAGGAIYIRPILFGIDEFIGMRPSTDYRFVILTSPAGNYFHKAVKAFVTTEFSRAAEGGVGNVKMAGNYARSMYAGQQAREMGYESVLWLDARERKYVEEYSTMNAFFVINNTLITPALTQTFLAGITRDTILQLGREMGLKVEERPIAMDEIVAAAHRGELQEAFGTGTAATMAPIQGFRYLDQELSLPPVEEWHIMPLLAERLHSIRSGASADDFGWMVPIL